MEGKYWCLTWNNYPENNWDKILENLNYSYGIFGKEVGENGTKHIQGYVEFKTNRKLKRLKKESSDQIHWETRRETAFIAAEYCKKDGDYIEIGEMSKPRQGARQDLSVIRKMVDEGKGMRDIVDVTESFQAIRFAETLLKYKEKKRDWEPEVIWLWGPTGVGKTRRAMEESNNPYMSMKNLKWWEGYDAHEDVILDDFRADFCTYHELLRILDRYEYRVEVKGTSRQLLIKRFWITSCYPPDKVYNTREDIGQLLRRITKVIEMRPETEVGGNTNLADSYDNCI